MDFRPEYCLLLKQQVEDELQYLRSHGHDSQYPTKPCIFCQESRNRYFCHRLEDLTGFLSQIMVEINKKQNNSTASLPNLSNPTLPLIGFSD